MKKIIGLILTALVIAGTVGSGIWASFSDSEASQNNTLTAGTLDLQVGAADPCTESINLGTQIMPGDSGNAADWITTNLGSISGTLRVTFGAVTNYENTRNEPEQAAGDTTSGATEGELGDFVDIALWLDMNQSGGWDSGDKYLGSDGNVYDWVSGGSPPPAAYNDINNYAGLDWDSSDGMPTLVGSADLDFMVEYDFPSNANDNRAQSDSSEFDITFTLEQV